MKKIFLAISLLLFVTAPYLTFAAGGLIPCDENSNGRKGCQFKDFVPLFKGVMDFLLVGVLIPAATIAIAVVGIQYLTAVGNPGKLAKAHEVLIDVLWGIFIAIAAWAIVDTIFSVLTKAGTLPPITG
ncbi:MAG: hypothetical protein Q7S19_00035 [bacterium]|nr:hypothetical protein [bacterium]